MTPGKISSMSFDVVSIPAGMSDNLPVGLQLMAPQKADRHLLALAKQVEELLS